MYKRKRLVSLLLVSALASGCASAGKTEETTQPPKTTQEEAETTGTDGTVYQFNTPAVL